MGLFKGGGVFGDIGGALGLNVDDQIKAAEDAAAVQQRAGEAAIEEQRAARLAAEERLQPFTQFGTNLLQEQGGFLTDPQAQFAFLQNNPLFELALQNANRQTERTAAASGRSSFGTTQQDLARNVLLSAQPLIGQQSQNLLNAINLGQTSAAGQANIGQQAGANISNLLTQIGNAQAGGIAGASQAKTQQAQNIQNILGQVAAVVTAGAGAPLSGGQPTFQGLSPNLLLNNPGNTLGSTQNPGGFGNIGVGV
jgi:hypothetical protein